MASIINAATSGGLISTADTSGILQLQTAGTTAVTVDALQNVGVGTTSPGFKLDVALSSSDVYSASGTTINTQQTSAISIKNTSNTASTNFAAIYLNSRTSSAVAARIAVTGEHFVGDGSCLAFSTRGSANTAYTEHGRFTAAGRLLLGLTSANASGGVLQISNGITFPATQSASTDANTLDDYEEGTWTPTLTAGSGSVASYSTQSGSYTKIGNVVCARFRLDILDKGSLSGSLAIGGLPFTVGEVGASCAFNSFGTGNLNISSILGYPGGATTSIFLNVIKTASSSSSALTAADIGTDPPDWYGMAVYRV